MLARYIISFALPLPLPLALPLSLYLFAFVVFSRALIFFYGLLAFSASVLFLKSGAAAYGLQAKSHGQNELSETKQTISVIFNRNPRAVSQAGWQGSHSPLSTLHSPVTMGNRNVSVKHDNLLKVRPANG